MNFSLFCTGFALFIAIVVLVYNVFRLIERLIRRYLAKRQNLSVDTDCSKSVNASCNPDNDMVKSAIDNARKSMRL